MHANIATKLTTILHLVPALALGALGVACDAEEPTGALTAQEEAHLETFDELDFEVFTNQRWEDLDHSHAEDVIVHWPDGHATEGIDVHIADLSGMFVYAPDTRIEEHPIRIASEEWTSVTGVLEGTFTEPMPAGDGTFIEPTGLAFEIPMATIGRWEDGVMVEEWLFWDNQAFLVQIGLAG
ncbi:ester cyclase [Pseudenhygromyxa sp. WMMC2535]|uniref:ester cyclase n=1 Tax=Pseudenhygromyxa sp. WMMC2535 TaxID=2712867 RepID=UPI001551D079|nr:ester cyclase [Pseudenhygromyxa sp. WMMC2535]NVB39131.1 ester cyclase [Pseudenhygromyxa sp. WMMC2535]